MSNFQRFTTLEQSLASFGVAVHAATTNGPESKKKKDNRKGAQKAKSADAAAIDNVAVDHTADPDDGWMPVVSRKSKPTCTLKDSESVAGVSATLANEVQTFTQNVKSPAPSSSQLMSTNTTTKKKRRKIDGVKEVKVPVEDLKITLGSSQMNQQRFKNASPDRCLDYSSAMNDEKNGIVLYARELEYLVSEILGVEAVVKARVAFPDLVFPWPPPTTTSLSDPNQPILSLDYIRMKAHLRAKEAECQVLCDEIARLHNRVNKELRVLPLLTMESSQKESTDKVFEQQLKRSIPTVSTYVQCEISAPLTSTAEPRAQSPSATSKSTQVVITTLQDEIARLARENVLLTQRYANLEGRLKNSERQNSKLQSKIHKAASVASKETEAAVRNQMDEIVKNLQIEVTEKDKLLSAKTAQLESLEKSKNEVLQSLVNLKMEYNKVLEAKCAEELHAAESMKVLDQMRVEKEKVFQEKDILFQNLNLLRSSKESEVNGLRQNLMVAEAQLKATLDECTHLKEELTSAESQLSVMTNEMTEMSEKHSNEVSELKIYVKELVARNEELGKSSPVGPIMSTLNVSCLECDRLSEEVARYQAVLASTEDALSHLQRSAGKEEARWRLALHDCCAENAQLKVQLQQLTSQLTAFKIPPRGKNSDSVSSCSPLFVQNGWI